MMEQKLKTILGTLRDFLTYHRFNSESKGFRYRGVYASFDAAHADLPKDQPQGFDFDEVPTYFIENEFMLNPGDYPILFWLSQILKPEMSVFDLGGGFGQCYYCYQSYLPFPVDLRWEVCEVEAFVNRGKQLAEERNASLLTFTSDRLKASGASLYLTNGALHYFDPDLPGILAQLAVKPLHVLVNRVPMYDGERYYTLQKTNHSYAVNKVINIEKFVREMEGLGYERVDQWMLPRSLRIPFHAERSVSNFRGFYFRMRDGSAASA